ncbi:MAG: hypothetical protein ACI31V_01980 [Bacilli bacterium]
MKEKLFNIYYLNLSKVYELAMILDNMILKNMTREISNSKENIKERKAELGVNYMNTLNSSVGENNSVKSSISNKVIETLDIMTTKSVLLRNILGTCIKIGEGNTDINVGDLVYIDDVRFTLENETELRAFKMLRNDAIKGLNYEGLDLNNLITSILNDYSYNLVGNSKSLEKKILLKIPMLAGSEFENLYTIDDLLIGSVSIIGIYRGITKLSELKNSFNILKNIDSSGSEKKGFNYEESDGLNLKEKSIRINDAEDYYFIDIIAIIQNVKSKYDYETKEESKEALKETNKRGILRRILDKISKKES